MMPFFDVALWQVWPSPIPEYIGFVEAPTTFASVESLMCFHNLVFVAYTCVRTLDGSLIYRS